jgi:RNA polymerase-binding transcription factor DksA
MAKKSTPAKKVVAKKSAPAKKAAPAKKIVAKKATPAKKVAPAKKVVAKKAVPAKKVAPAKKVVAKKAAPAKKVTPAKKVIAKKVAPVKKAAPAKKVVAPVKKAAPAKKVVAPVKKAAPAKKVVAPVKKVKPAPAVIAKPATVKKPEAKTTAPVYKPAPEINKVPVKMPAEPVKGLRYSDSDLKEFQILIKEKLEQSRSDFEELKESLSREGDNSTDDTSPTFKMMEDGSDTNSREEVAQLASRQEKFIKNLENALLRIMNKTYGVCRVTGQLIPKERLRLVPHATLSIEAKNMQ